MMIQSLAQPTIERRCQRSANTTRALCLQLDATLRRAGLESMILTDDRGVCLAAAGDGDTCDEIAAQLPLVARKADYFDGQIGGPEMKWDVYMERFDVLGAPLYLCAVGTSLARNTQVKQSIAGVSRILLPA